MVLVYARQELWLVLLVQIVSLVMSHVQRELELGQQNARPVQLLTL